MFGITKKDLEVFLDLVLDIGKWALGGFDPMIPEIEDEDFVRAESGVKPDSGGLSQPVDARPTQVGPVGETPATSSNCKSCGGTGQIGVGASGGGMSFHYEPCYVCNSPFKELFTDRYCVEAGPPILPIDPQADKLVNDIVDRKLLEKRVGKLEKENAHLKECLSEMGKIFREYRDTGKVV